MADTPETIVRKAKQLIWIFLVIAVIGLIIAVVLFVFSSIDLNDCTTKEAVFCPKFTCATSGLPAVLTDTNECDITQ